MNSDEYYRAALAERDRLMGRQPATKAQGQRKPSEYPSPSVPREADALEAACENLTESDTDRVFDVWAEKGYAAAIKYKAWLENMSPVERAARATMPELYGNPL